MVMLADLDTSAVQQSIANISLGAHFRDEHNAFGPADRALYTYLAQHPDKSFSHLYDASVDKMEGRTIDKTHISIDEFNPRIVFHDEPGNARWLMLFGKAEKIDSQSGMQLGLCTLVESMRQLDVEIANTPEAELSEVEVLPLIYPHFEDIGDQERPTPVFKPKQSFLLFLTKDQYQLLHQTVDDFLTKASSQVVQ